MPQGTLKKDQVEKIRKGCMTKFDDALDSCLKDGILTTNQCLEDAANEWVKCMERNGVTIKARSSGEKPKPKRPRR